MCEFSRKLIAWLDGELSEGEIPEIERHVEICAECRDRLDAYRVVTARFDSYCDAYCSAISAVNASGVVPGWQPDRTRPRRAQQLVSAALAVAAAVAILLLAPQPNPSSSSIVQSADSRPVAAPPSDGTVAQIEITDTSAAISRSAAHGIQPENPPALSKSAAPASFPGLAAIEIAIPGDTLFAPGAVPAGIDFTGDVTFAPDGSTQEIRLRPELAQFERR